VNRLLCASVTTHLMLRVLGPIAVLSAENVVVEPVGLLTLVLINPPLLVMDHA
jgi:hypothetical protein